MTYLAWNTVLARHFFRTEMDHQRVHLYVTEELIEDLGRDIGGGTVDDFVAAVETGPPRATREGLCQRALEALEGWRDKDLEDPPYIAYLGLFVLAAGVEGDFAPHAYYPRLRQLLDYPPGPMLPSFNRMYELWDDLEMWSVRDRRGELGVFEAQIAGNQFHIGLPLAQTILTEEERRALPVIFSIAGLDPTSVPPEGEVLRALRLHGTGLLRPRTLERIRSASDEDVLAALADTVLGELEAWDGRVEPDLEGSGAYSQGTLRLCLRVDPVAGRAAASLRCRLNREFPEGSLTLVGPDGPVWCEEQLPGWSSRLRVVGTDATLDASGLDWGEGATYLEEDFRLRFRLPGTAVRVLVEGTADGLPNLVEAHRLRPLTPFWVLYRDDARETIEPWGSAECRDFRERELEGLPAGWKAASVGGAVSDRLVRAQFPQLGFATRVRLRLKGGVRSTPGNNFYWFAPPNLDLEGGEGSEEVWCGEQRLQPDEPSALISLPASVPVDARITVEAKRAGEIVARQSLYLTGNFSWRMSEPLRVFDRWGDRTAGDDRSGNWIAGAQADCEDAPDVPTHGPLLLQLELARHRVGRVFLIGRRAGQAERWRGDRLPDGWKPVWLVPIGRRGRAVYVGGATDDTPLPASPTDPGDRQTWRQVLWRWRNRIEPPTNPPLQELWRSYVRAAR